ncbi:four helix bundle protein [Maribacter algicola]|uniref:Four helix bundle protein n=1 Tax=Meishania litoralis TaxID=3434685 RepID=A0ACC7LMN7_9FLAO
MNNYRELIVWQKSISIVEKVYTLTSSFPDEEKYGLTGQIRRSSVSIASNIAEGAGRNSKKEFRNFLGMANGSLNEMNTQLEISKRLGLINEIEFKSILKQSDEIQKMIYTLIKKFSQI